MKINTFLICIILFFYTTLQGQSPYQVTWKKEIPYLATVGGTLGLGAFLHTLPPIYTPDEIITLNPQDVNSFDRFATGIYSDRADKNSDFFWIGSHALPLLFLTDEKSKRHFGQILTMYGEAAFINAGLTIIAKSTFRRPRPYILNSDVPVELKLNRNAKASFLSGHASMTAVNTFFAAKVFSDFYPDSKWKPVVWTGAAVIPAITGYLRVAAGRHYPTDVIAGYALGATIGVLVPHLHRNRQLKEKGITLQTGMNGARLTWRFNQQPLERFQPLETF